MTALARRLSKFVWNQNLGILAGVNFGSQNHIQFAPRRGYRDISDDAAVNLHIYKNIETPVPPVWLRHHCQCSKCVHPATYQRVPIPSHLKNNSKIENVSRLTENNEDCFQIVWNDGHVSNYTLKWLQDILSPENNLRTDSHSQIFSIEPVTTFPTDIWKLAVHYEDFLGDDQALTKSLKGLASTGVALIVEAPPTLEATKKAIHRISHPQTTIYGSFYEFESNLLHADTAYTSDHVYMHTDGTYFTEPNGLQVFHCLNHDGDGGVNALVDGYKIAREIQQENMVQYEILSSTPVPWHYVDPEKYHFYNVAPIFQHDPFTGKLGCIRYNPHDMALVNTIPVNKLSEFYASIINLSDRIENSVVWLKLNPGMILITDNWRVLHGRSAFTGYRKMCGCYISRSDWLSKCRTMFS